MCLFVVSFKYFNQNTPNILVSLSLQGRGFSKAMTVKETEAYVGDVKYDVTVLRDDNLFLVPPDKESQTSATWNETSTNKELDIRVRGSSHYY